MFAEGKVSQAKGVQVAGDKQMSSQREMAEGLPGSSRQSLCGPYSGPGIGWDIGFCTSFPFARLLSKWIPSAQKSHRAATGAITCSLSLPCPRPLLSLFPKSLGRKAMGISRIKKTIFFVCLNSASGLSTTPDWWQLRPRL